MHLLVDDRIQSSQTVLTERMAAVELPRKSLDQVVGAVTDNTVQLTTVSRRLGCCDLTVLSCGVCHSDHVLHHPAEGTPLLYVHH